MELRTSETIVPKIQGFSWGTRGGDHAEEVVAIHALLAEGEAAGEVGCVLLLEKVAVFGIAAEGSAELVKAATGLGEVDSQPEGLENAYIAVTLSAHVVGQSVLSGERVFFPWGLRSVRHWQKPESSAPGPGRRKVEFLGVSGNKNLGLPVRNPQMSLALCHAQTPIGNRGPNPHQTLHKMAWGFLSKIVTLPYGVRFLTVHQ